MALVLVLFISSLSQATIPVGWPMLRQNEQRTGYIAGHSHFADSAIKKWDLIVQNSEVDIIYSSPISADFTGDNKNDILIGSFGPEFPVADLYTGFDGSVIWATPDSGVGSYFGTPALMDINSDGKPEIFENVAESTIALAPKGYFKAYDGNNGMLLWKKKIMYCDSMWSGIQGGYCAPLAIEGDSGTVIAGDDEGVLWGFNATSGNVRWADTLTINLQPPSRGEVDGDGNKEIMVVGGNTLYALSDFGVLKWSISLVDSATTPVLANLDADPELEIIVYCYVAGAIRAFNSNNATPFINMGVGPFTPDFSPETWGPTPWPPSPGVADVTGDGTPDIIIHNGKSLCCINGASGAVEWNKTYSNLFGSPVMSDLDNDSYNEIIVTGQPPDTAHRAQVNCFEHNGDKKWDWNSAIGDTGFRDPALNEACLTDVDNDGDLEISVVDYSCYSALLDVPGGAVEEGERKGDAGSIKIVNPLFNNYIELFMQEKGSFGYKIYDVTGRVVIKGNAVNTGEKIRINTNEIRKGVYFLKVNSGEVSNTLKVLKML